MELAVQETLEQSEITQCFDNKSADIIRRDHFTENKCKTQTNLYLQISRLSLKLSKKVITCHIFMYL